MIKKLKAYNRYMMQREKDVSKVPTRYKRLLLRFITDGLHVASLKTKAFVLSRLTSTNVESLQKFIGNNRYILEECVLVENEMRIFFMRMVPHVRWQWEMRTETASTIIIKTEDRMRRALFSHYATVYESQRWQKYRVRVSLKIAMWTRKSKSHAISS